MIAQWTGDVVGKMHIYRITSLELANEVGWHDKYLSSVINGRRTPKNAESQLREALDRLIAKKEG